MSLHNGPGLRRWNPFEGVDEKESFYFFIHLNIIYKGHPLVKVSVLDKTIHVGRHRMTLTNEVGEAMGCWGNLRLRFPNIPSVMREMKIFVPEGKFESAAIAYNEIYIPVVREKTKDSIPVIDAYYSVNDEQMENRTGNLLMLLGKLIDTLLHDQ